MTDPPRRYKTDDELTVEELLERDRAQEAGRPVKFETDEYRAAKRQALTDAGLEPDEPTDIDGPPDEAWSVEDHLNAIRKGGD